MRKPENCKRNFTKLPYEQVIKLISSSLRTHKLTGAFVLFSLEIFGSFPSDVRFMEKYDENLNI